MAATNAAEGRADRGEEMERKVVMVGGIVARVLLAKAPQVCESARARAQVRTWERARARACVRACVRAHRPSRAAARGLAESAARRRRRPRRSATDAPVTKHGARQTRVRTYFQGNGRRAGARKALVGSSQQRSTFMNEGAAGWAEKEEEEGEGVREERKEARKDGI
eukprot:4685128-Pleurochrysis_carterae.AAC.1